jgi:uncharacterized protein with PQ loop repeat
MDILLPQTIKIFSFKDTTESDIKLYIIYWYVAALYGLFECTLFSYEINK